MMATDDTPRRWEAATGIAFVVLVLGGLIVQGKPPKADDSIDEIRSFFSHRGAILAGDYLIGMGWAFFLWFLGSVRFYLRAGAGGDDRFWGRPRSVEQWPVLCSCWPPRRGSTASHSRWRRLPTPCSCALFSISTTRS
jgi:hypothetical protein